MTVSADATVRVTETITYDFTTNSRHGIYRTIPTTYSYDATATGSRRSPMCGYGMDGQPVTVQRTDDGGGVVLQIGDPDHTTTGRHTYVIEYRMDGAVAGDELTWNVTGNRLGGADRCGHGDGDRPGRHRRDGLLRRTGRQPAHLSTRSVSTSRTAPPTLPTPSLAPSEGLTVVVAVPAGTVAGPAPILTPRRDLAAAFRATPTTVGGGIALAVLGVAAALLVAYLVGRRRSGGLDAADERRPPDRTAEPVALEFSPPAGLRPGQVGTLLDERVHLVDITATIVDFAVRRHLQIRELPDGDWDLVQLGPPDPAFLPYERSLFDALFDDRHRVRLSELRRTFRSDFDRFRRQLYAETVAQGWYRCSPARTRVIAWTSRCWCWSTRRWPRSSWRQFHLGLLGGGLLRRPSRCSSWRGGSRPVRPTAARRWPASRVSESISPRSAWSRSTPTSGPGSCPTYLPYAMVFGLTDRWTDSACSADPRRTPTPGSALLVPGPIDDRHTVRLSGDGSRRSSPQRRAPGPPARRRRREPALGRAVPEQDRTPQGGRFIGLGQHPQVGRDEHERVPVPVL